MLPHRSRRLVALLAVAGLSLPCASAAAQDPAVPEPGARDPEPLTGRTLVTASRTDQPLLDTPWAVEVVDEVRILERSYRTTPQALRDLPGVMVQETSHGQGSPYIRGFTGFRNLFLIDGIRLNNSVFRDGPNQYWNTVDPFTIQRLEIVKGPGSVVHGSDSIGGTVNAITRDPYGYGAPAGVAGRMHWRVSAAEDSHVGRLEVSAPADRDFGLLLGATLKEFGDVHGGHDVGVQPYTGYDEQDADVKLEHFLDPETRLVVGHQHVRQDDVPRTHRTIWAKSFAGTTIGSDLARELDQERRLTWVQLHGAEGGASGDTWTASLSWQEQSELRDRTRSDSSMDQQGFDVGTLGLFAHTSEEFAGGRLTWGFDAYHDQVDSFSSTNPVQGPVADDATYDLVGAFVQDQLELDERTELTLGARFQYAAVDANQVLDPVSSNAFAIDDEWSTVVGSARLLRRLPGDETSVFAGVSQGFRAPNLSDLTRFDSAGTNEFEIPSPGLDPEHTVTWELGARRELETLSWQTALFYTDVRDLIVRTPTGNVNMDGDFEVTKTNSGDGHVYGIETGAAWSVAEAWTLFGNLTWLTGRVEVYPTSSPVLVEEYIDRLMPLTGQVGLRWEPPAGRTWAELVTVAADDADRLSTRDANDTSRIPPGGTPDYLVVHLRGGWRVSSHATLDVGLENLTDEDYRIHGSGLNMPGRNLIVGFTLDL